MTKANASPRCGAIARRARPGQCRDVRVRPPRIPRGRRRPISASSRNLRVNVNCSSQDLIGHPSGEKDGSVRRLADPVLTGPTSEPSFAWTPAGDRTHVSGIATDPQRTDRDMSLGAREEDRDRLVGSLETIIQTLLGRELDTLRQSVSDLGSDLARRIDASSEETTGNLEALRTEMLSEGEGAKREALSAMETLRNDVFSEIESARQEAIGSIASLKETLTASIEENRTRASTLEETVTRTLADLAARATEIDERADTRLETTKRDLEQKLEDAASRLQEEGHSLLARLDAAEHELREHTTASGRVVEVLDSLGEVLSRKTGEIVDPPQQPAAEMSPGQDEPSESADTEEVEDALERVFPLMPTQTSPRIPE